MSISISRRFVLVAVALTFSTLFFKGTISTALVTRGDDFLYRSDTNRAMRYYERSLMLDKDNGVAADRYVFVSTQIRTASALMDGVRVASRYLQAHPNDHQVLFDRGLAYQILRNYRRAATDFARAAAVGGDARDYTFAGWAAYRAGDRANARALWRRALARSPRFTPAIHALAKTS